MKVLKDQRGIGHVVEIVIIAVILLGVGGFIAWRVWFSGSSTGTPTNEAQSALQQALANAQCDYDDKDICKFMTSVKLSQDFKLTSKNTVDGQETTAVFESTNNGDNSRTVMNYNGTPYEVIIIGNTRYTKDNSDGKWWKEVVEPAEVSETNADYDVDFEEPSATEEPDKTVYKKLGTEACGNLTCFKYQIIDPASPDYIQYLWFDNKDYQTRRMVSESPDGKSDMTYEYTGISISAPSPTKDLPPNSYINPATGEAVTMPSAEDFFAE